ncbi:hypothetical protein LLH06_10330 [Mucilaginibacter daejeonensis]|uniref:hypothetical protein n=1 Tax=Mucilaginibacter daejeonensis TaxID=398049 RepID=UPI001D16FFCB|nr:hypothetical protein [Mucilaginibacter daejeonensis]UEG51369.1 hypothetical protein LLH06_10330 [Mucilaginibacter daejeonensis]
MFQLLGQYAFRKTSKIQLAGGLHYHCRSSRYYLLSDRLIILASTYAAKFKGGVISLAADHQASTALSIGALAGYSLGDYKGVADWNLIDLFEHPVSFVQTGNIHIFGY